MPGDLVDRAVGAAADHPDVATATGWPDGGGGAVLAVVPAMYASAARVRVHVVAQVGTSMPVTVAVGAALPPAPTGVDDLRRAGFEVSVFVEPTTPVEKVLCGIWSAALSGVHVGVADGLLDLGGDSLTAVEIQAAIARDLRVEISIEDLFELATPAAVAASIAARGAAAQQASP